MKQSTFQPIELVSRQFEMSQIWLHQLRIRGLIETKCLRGVCGRARILYNSEDVEKWTQEHDEVYQDRRKQGCYDKVSKTAIVPIRSV